MTDKYFNRGYLTFLSHGGNGGPGQDGKFNLVFFHFKFPTLQGNKYWINLSNKNPSNFLIKVSVKTPLICYKKEKIEKKSFLWYGCVGDEQCFDAFNI